jgi:hypothetical protein
MEIFLMRHFLILFICFLTTGSVFAQTESPETTPEPVTAPKIFIQMNTLNPWAIMSNDSMLNYNIPHFTLYDDGLLIYYGVSPENPNEYHYYSMTVDVELFMAQFDLNEFSTFADEYIEQNLMDANTIYLTFYIPQTDTNKTVQIYGYDIPNNLQTIINTLYEFVETPHDDAQIFVPNYVLLHLVPITDLALIREDEMVDIDLLYLLEDLAIALELKSSDALADGLELLIDYERFVAELDPLLGFDKPYIRTSRPQVWRYWVEIIPFLP